MEWFNSFLAVLTGLAIRLAIPIGITLLVIYILRKVDVRWQEEASQTSLPMVERPHCWDINNCPVEKMRDCPVPTSVKPCWQVHRLNNGYLREECLDCQVFHQAPIPTPVHP
jgi:hypothetical protein